jgi:hypothetical protein
MEWIGGALGSVLCGEGGEVGSEGVGVEPAMLAHAPLRREQLPPHAAGTAARHLRISVPTLLRVSRTDYLPHLPQR